MRCMAGKAIGAWYRLPSGLCLLGCRFCLLGVSSLAWLVVREPCRLPFQNQLLMPLEFDKKKEVMRIQVKLECQQAGKKIFCYFGVLEQFSYCTWFVCLLLCLRKEKNPPDFETKFPCNTCQLILTRER